MFVLTKEVYQYIHLPFLSRKSKVPTYWWMKIEGFPAIAECGIQTSDLEMSALTTRPGSSPPEK